MTEGKSDEALLMNSLVRVLLLAGLFLSVFISFNSLLHADIYEWTDKKGNLHFTDTPPPQNERSGKVKTHRTIEREEPVATKSKIPLEKEVPEAINTRIPSPSEVTPPQNEKRAYSDINVIIYTTSWCGYCRKAIEYLRSLGVNYTEYNVGKDKAKKKEQLEKSGGHGGVPLLDIEGIIVRGYNPQAIKTALDKRRES